MNRAYRSLLVLIPGLVLGGCSDSSPSEPSVRNVAGVWQFTETFSNAQLQVSCNNAGTLTLTQNGTNLSGTASQVGECNGPGGVFDNSGSGSITGGQVQGSSMTLESGGCQYAGTISGSPANRMSGTVSCLIGLSGQTYNFSGTWQASR